MMDPAAALKYHLVVDLDVGLRQLQRQRFSLAFSLVMVEVVAAAADVVTADFVVVVVVRHLNHQ